MSSKVNNKVPHTRINSIGTSFAQAQAKNDNRPSLFTPPFWIWSEENWVKDRNTWMNWHQTHTAAKHLSLRENVAVTTAASSCELEAKYYFYFNEVHRR